MGRLRRLAVSSALVAVLAGCGSAVEVDGSASTVESSETGAVGESSSEVEGAIEPGDGGDTDYEPPSEEGSSNDKADGSSTVTQTSTEAPEDESGDVWQDEEEPEGDEYDYWSDFAKLEVSEEVPRDGYDRDGWRHWIDGSNTLWGRNDADCDTRELIVKWSEVLLVPQDWDGCDPPVGGAWFSDYDGAWTTDSSTFDLDHVVSLAEAWDSGGASWSAERRETFANDPFNLVLVSASSALSKGDKDVAEWKPSEHLHCSMAATVVHTKVKYGLTVDQAERDALNEMLQTCDNNSWRSLRAGLGRGNSNPFVTAAIEEHSSTAPSGSMFIEGMFWPNNSCPTDVGVAVYELEDGRTPTMTLLLDDVIVDDDVNFTFTGIEVQVGQNVFTEAGYFLISIGTDVRDVEPGTYQARAEVSDGVSTEILEFEVVVDECGGRLVDGVAIDLIDFQTNASNCGDGCIHLIFDFDLTYNVSRPLSVKWQHDFSEYSWMSEERELLGGFAQEVRLRSYQTLTFESSAECENELYDKLLPLLIEVEHETGATVLDALGFWIDEGCT